MLIAAVLALLLWWLWPSSAPPVEAPPPEIAAVAPNGKGISDKQGPKPVPKPAKPVVRPPPPEPEVDAKALREAIARRSKDLEVCNASGAPERLHARLMMSRQGAVKSVTLSQSGQLPAEVASCVKERVRAWNFSELALSSDVDVMVTFSLTPGLAAAATPG